MARILRSIVTAVATASAVRALNYAIPAGFPMEILATTDCIMPQNFVVDQLVVWEPAPTNPNQNDTADFHFTDVGTGIDTYCHKNADAPNVAGQGDAPRYNCDNPLIQFIWVPGKLTLIEKVCNGTTGFQASGALQPGFECVPTDPSTPAGPGFACTAVNTPLNGSFSSLQPAPPSGNRVVSR